MIRSTVGKSGVLILEIRSKILIKQLINNAMTYSEPLMEVLSKKLSGLLFMNDLAYSHQYESWLARVPGTEEWGTVKREMVITIAAWILAGMTDSIIDGDLTDKCLILIERWAIASNDSMGCLTTETSSNPWRPTCLLPQGLERDNSYDLIRIND